MICLPILDGNDALTDLVCSVLALRGVPAIMFRLPYYGERGLPGGPEVLAKDPKMFAGESPRQDRICGGPSTCWPPGRKSTRIESE